MILALFFAAAATAAAPACFDTPIQPALNACAGNEFKKADARLNALYRQLMSRYDAPNQALLKAAEQKWIAWRDAECDYETNASVGGTVHPMTVALCWTQKTNKRIEELKGQRDCGDGDLSCNPPDK